MTEEEEKVEERHVFMVTKELLATHEEEISKMRGKVFHELDNEISPLKGVDRFLAFSRWADAMSAVGNYATKRAIVERETMLAKGTEIQIDHAVKMEEFQKAMRVESSPQSSPAQTPPPEYDGMDELPENDGE